MSRTLCIAVLSLGMIATIPCLSYAADKASVSEDLILPRGDEGLLEAERLMRKGEYADALTILDKVIARNMRNTDAHVYSAVSWMKLGNLAKAKNSINNAIGIDVGHMGAYVIAGEIALKERNLQQAEYFLGALKVLCQAKCPEYHALDKMIREYKD